MGAPNTTVPIIGTPKMVPLILGDSNPYNPLYNPSFHLIFHFLVHLIRHSWGNIPKAYTLNHTYPLWSP